MTYYEKVKQMMNEYAQMNPQPRYDKAVEMVGKELGMTSRDVLMIIMSGMYRSLSSTKGVKV